MVSQSKPFIRESTLADVLELSKTMRTEDRQEIAHAGGGTPNAALMAGFCSSLRRHLQTIEWDGKVVAMFGVSGYEGVRGVPWMLGTDDLRRCWSLLRECRRVLDGYTEEYRYLTNRVWSKNEVHVKWIKWLGFTFEGSSVSHGETFLHFHRSA